VLARPRLPLVPGAVSLQLVQNFKEERTHSNSSCFGRVKGLRYVNFFPEAHLAAEAYIHHMCTVANLIKTCCFEGAACDLVTSLGPERFTEWKAALINHVLPERCRTYSGCSKQMCETEDSNHILRKRKAHSSIDHAPQATTLPS
jgi:hypothetical protein